MRRRAFGAALILSGSAVAHGQVSVFGPTGSMIRSLQEHALIPTLDPTAPVADVQKVPEPQSEDKEFKLVSAKLMREIGHEVMIVGPTEFYVQGYHIFADEVVGNLTTKIFNKCFR